MDLKKIGACLRDLRKEKGLTQEQLAERFSVSQRTVSRWETGTATPDLDVLLQLANFYEVDLRALLNGEIHSFQMSQETKETIQEVSNYSKEEKRVKKRILKLTAIVVTSNLMIPLAITLAIFGLNPFSEQYDDPVAPGWERIMIRFIIFMLFLAAAIILSFLLPKPVLVLPVTIIPLGVMLLYLGSMIYTIQNRIPLSHVLIDDTYFDPLMTFVCSGLVALSMLTVMIVRMVKVHMLKMKTR